MFFQADMARLGKYCMTDMAGFGSLGIRCVNVTFIYILIGTSFCSEMALDFLLDIHKCL